METVGGIAQEFAAKSSQADAQERRLENIDAVIEKLQFEEVRPWILPEQYPKGGFNSSDPSTTYLRVGLLLSDGTNTAPSWTS